ncbi:MAG: PEP/pyruvate-binding domain-containing protein [Syntrophomonadaceae bacterium]
MVGEGFFFNLSEVFTAGVEAVGGKGWNLARLERYGFTVPVGGVLSADAYKAYIKENNLSEAIAKISAKVTVSNIVEKEIEEELLKLREKIKAGLFPLYIQDELIAELKGMGILSKPLAVRSSATCEDSARASFAGMHDSFLNICGTDNIILAVKECYASLWTPRAVAYRRKMQVGDDEVFQAVVILELIEAVAAGVGFTCDPRSGREDVVLINANFGLGESVVSGAVEPDEYRLDAKLEIMERKMGRKESQTAARPDGGTELIASPDSSGQQVLSDENIKRLGLVIRRVYDAMSNEDQHQDIEWVFDGRDFVLVQARPVTAKPRYTFPELKDQPDIWSNTNLKEAVPMVLPILSWNVIQKTWMGPIKLVSFVGYRMPPGLQCYKRFEGRFYWNSSLIQWIFYDSSGAREAMKALGGQEPEIRINEDNPYRGIKGLKRIGRGVKAVLFIIKNSRTQTAFGQVDKFTDAFTKQDLRNLSDNDLIKTTDVIGAAWREYVPVFYACTLSMAMPRLIKALEKYLPNQGNAIANALMIGQGDITSAEQGYRLIELAETARDDNDVRAYLGRSDFNPYAWEKELPEESTFKRLFRNFLDQYGHRGVYEMDISNPRWREDPSYPLNVIKSTMETANFGDLKERQQAKVKEVWRKVEQEIPKSRHNMIRKLVEKSVKGLALREMAKFELLKFYEIIRKVFLEMGSRLQDRGILIEKADVFHCSWIELFSILKGDWSGRGLKLLVEERKEWMENMEKLSPPDYYIDETSHFIETIATGSGSVLEGLGVSAGRASGPAKLLEHPDQEKKLNLGDILVAPTTDPGWTPLFLRAAAIVLERGGIGSHGAIVAREYGIPCVLNIPGAMRLVKEGQNVVVDGDEGKIYMQ